MWPAFRDIAARLCIGFVSGDTHSSKPLELGMSEEDTRFNGLKRECSLHFEI
ncbi:hypothetical protein [Shewanella violacea]|uniref:hypothetical protein n=1 Tax=Shewanella violacea TaxID=60217 RepID=UPI0003025AD3